MIVGMAPVMGAAQLCYFDRFDADGDGVITKAEVEAAAVARFTESDSNGDGSLSAEEMIAAAESRHANRHSDRIAKRIEKHDANGDGLLSLEEVTVAASTGVPEKCLIILMRMAMALSPKLKLRRPNRFAVGNAVAWIRKQLKIAGAGIINPFISGAQL